MTELYKDVVIDARFFTTLAMVASSFFLAIVRQTSDTLLVEAADGSTVNELFSGRSYFSRAGVEHNVVNASDGEFAFLEVEVES